MESERVYGCVGGHRLATLKYNKCDCYRMFVDFMETEDGQPKYLHYCKVCGMLFVRDHKEES